MRVVLGMDSILESASSVERLDLAAAAAEDRLLAPFTGVEKLLQWHSGTFSLPEGAVHLAESDACAQQAFRMGDRVYGLQFHLEVDAPMIGRWLDVPGHQAELDALGGEALRRDIRTQTPEHIGRLSELAEAVFGGFVSLFDMPAKRRVLPSR